MILKKEKRSELIEEARKRTKNRCPHYNTEKSKTLIHCLDCNRYFARRDDESLMAILLEYIGKLEYCYDELIREDISAGYYKQINGRNNERNR